MSKRGNFSKTIIPQEKQFDGVMTTEDKLAHEYVK
jgi:hypothetical protein